MNEKKIDRKKIDAGIGSLPEAAEIDWDIFPDTEKDLPVNDDAISLIGTSYPYVTFENEANARSMLIEWASKHYHLNYVPWSACVTLSDLTKIDPRNIQKFLINEGELLIKSKSLKNSILRDLLTVELDLVTDQLSFVKHLQANTDGAIIDFTHDPTIPLTHVKGIIKECFNEIKDCYYNFWEYMPYESIDRLEHFSDFQNLNTVSDFADKKMKIFYGSVHEFQKNPENNFGKTKIFVIALIDKNVDKIRYVPTWSNFIKKPPTQNPPLPF